MKEENGTTEFFFFFFFYDTIPIPLNLNPVGLLTLHSIICFVFDIDLYKKSSIPKYKKKKNYAQNNSSTLREKRSMRVILNLCSLCCLLLLALCPVAAIQYNLSYHHSIQKGACTKKKMAEVC